MIATLQSLRFFFILLIFLSHFAYGDIHALDAGGDCGVAFFFILSGFVLSLGYGRKLCDGTFKYRSFMWRRLRKLYPLHLLCLLFLLVVRNLPIDDKVLLNALLLQSWVPCQDYYFSCNSVSWFLSSLMFCYLVFPLAWRFASKTGLGVVLTIYAVICCVIPYEQINAILYVNPLVRFVDFYIGVVLCRLYEKYGPMYVTPQWTEWVVVVLLLLSLALYPFVDAKLRNAPMYWLVLIPLIWVFAQEHGQVSVLLRTKPITWLASLSMPIFLTHQIIIGMLLHRLPAIPAPLALGICFTIVLLVSWSVQVIFSRLFR